MMVTNESLPFTSLLDLDVDLKHNWNQEQYEETLRH